MSNYISERSTHPAQNKVKPLARGKGLGKGLAPKPKAKKPQAPAPASFFPGLGRGFGAIPPDIGDQDELSANFQRMMAELAHGMTSNQPSAIHAAHSDASLDTLSPQYTH